MTDSGLTNRTTTIHTEETRYVTVTGIEADPIDYGWSDPKNQLRPTTVKFAVRRFDDSEWLTSQVNVFGPRIRKDGSDGAEQRATFWSHSHDTEWPGWLIELVEAHTPAGVR